MFACVCIWLYEFLCTRDFCRSSFIVAKLYRYMDDKREVFFLKIFCRIFGSEMSMLPLKLTDQALEMFPKKLF